MSDLKKYINKRRCRDSAFAEKFETGYANFKIGVLLKQSRERAGMTPGSGCAQVEDKSVGDLQNGEPR